MTPESVMKEGVSAMACKRRKGRGGTESVATMDKVGRRCLDNLAATPTGWYGRSCVKEIAKAKPSRVATSKDRIL